MSSSLHKEELAQEYCPPFLNRFFSTFQGRVIQLGEPCVLKFYFSVVFYILIRGFIFIYLFWFFVSVLEI